MNPSDALAETKHERTLKCSGFKPTQVNVKHIQVNVKREFSALLCFRFIIRKLMGKKSGSTMSQKSKAKLHKDSPEVERAGENLYAIIS